jgi:hypothetical protein
VIVHFVDIGGIIDHHCLEAIVHFVDTGGIVDHQGSPNQAKWEKFSPYTG